MEETLIMFVNGSEMKITRPDPEMTLLTYLRDVLNLKGTKYGCGEGGCGACTVLVTKFINDALKHFSLNSCLAPLCSLHGVAITTVEGVGSIRTKMHPVQEVLATSHGSQCGYCTPGFIMSMYTLLCNKPQPCLRDIEQAFQGNLCRCTGYRPIVQGFSKFAVDSKVQPRQANEGDEGYHGDTNGDSGSSGSGNGGSSRSSVDRSSFVNSNNSSNSELSTISDNGKIFGVDLKSLNQLKDQTAHLDSQFLCFKSNYVTWYRPTNLNDLLDLKVKHPIAKLVIGNTEIGIEIRYKNMEYPVIISCSHINELNNIQDMHGTDGKKDVKENVGISNVDHNFSYDVDGGINVDGDKNIWVGASVTVSALETYLNEKIASLPEHRTRLFVSMRNMMKLFASPQIKNVASIGGNLMTASPISDLIPIFVSARSIMYIASKNHTRKRVLDGTFFTGYRRISIQPHEVLLKISLPYSDQYEYYNSFKQSRRRDDDISIVNASMWVKFKNKMVHNAHVNKDEDDEDGNDDGDDDEEEEDGAIVDDVILAFGGMSTSVMVANKTMNYLKGRKWDENLLNSAMKSLSDETSLDPGIPGGMEAYRSSLSLSFFFKFYVDVCLRLQNDHPKLCKTVLVSKREMNYFNEENHHEPLAIQVYDDDDEEEEEAKTPPRPYCLDTFINLDDDNDYDGEGDKLILPPTLHNNNNDNNCNNNNNNTNNININIKNINNTSNNINNSNEMATRTKQKLSVVGKPVMHMSGFKHTTGEAVYLDDMPRYKDELFLSFVLSTKSYARILSIDYKEALECEGVVGVVGAEDIPGDGRYGKIIVEEDVFYNEVVVSQYLPLIAIVSHTKSQGRKAVKKVKVEYKELPPVLSIQEAIAANSFLKPLPPFQNGDPLKLLDCCDHVIEGEVSLGGQEHFYMEPNACLVVPHEDGGGEVWSSTQHADIIQLTAAKVMGVPANKVVVKVARIGGGFGGKENKPMLLVLPSIVAAHKFKRPIRCTLDRDEDMMMTAGRHPYLAKYKVGFTKEGHIEALIIDLYANCGCTLDASELIIERATFQLDNMYHFKDILINRYMCKTNLPSNTAFRGFGAPQGTFICETIIEHVACFLNVPSIEVRMLNLYRDGELSMYNQAFDCKNILDRCWQQVMQQSDYEQQVRDIDEFNRMNRWVKRGICIIPSKYGVGYSHPFLQQAGALVNIYKDGSVLISHGGVEIGQGLHTKMIQVAAEVLQISTSLIHIHETNSHIVPNATSTSASSSSDLFGMAVVLACEKLHARLKPYMTSRPNDGWKEWVKRAYFDRVQLSATGFYKKAYTLHNLEKNKGRMFHYFSIAVACSVVEIDCLTGALQVLRTDIVMDVGKSLNPAIDVGQIEGAFMQGFGLYTMEELKYAADGRLLTNGPGTYKIPSVCDTPRVFNVTLLKNAPNLKAVYSSKAVGEPPLLLANGIVGAIRYAIKSARRDAGVKDDWFRLDTPATCERIRMACVDQFTQLYNKEKPENYKPWFKEIL